MYCNSKSNWYTIHSQNSTWTLVFHSLKCWKENLNTQPTSTVLNSITCWNRRSVKNLPPPLGAFAPASICFVIRRSFSCCSSWMRSSCICRWKPKHAKVKRRADKKGVLRQRLIFHFFINFPLHQSPRKLHANPSKVGMLNHEHKKIRDNERRNKCPNRDRRWHLLQVLSQCILNKKTIFAHVYKVLADRQTAKCERKFFRPSIKHMRDKARPNISQQAVSKPLNELCDKDPSSPS